MGFFFSRGTPRSGIWQNEMTIASSPSTLQSNSRPLLRLPLEESAPEEQGQEEGQEEGRQVNLLPVGAGGLEGWLYEHEEMARRQAGCGEI